jgi:hypothetical protein
MTVPWVLRSVYLPLPTLADAVADCKNDCRSAMTEPAAESPLGDSSEVSYCAALSDSVADVAHDEERMKEKGIGRERKGKLGLYLRATLNCSEAGAHLTKQTKLQRLLYTVYKSPCRCPKSSPTSAAAIPVLLAVSCSYDVPPPIFVGRSLNRAVSLFFCFGPSVLVAIVHFWV